MIPILNDVNREVGYLPSEALEEVALLLQVSKSQVFSVATFYQMLSTIETAGMSFNSARALPATWSAGARSGSACGMKLCLEAGETSPDKKWTLVTVSCLGVCGVGPVMVVDDDMYGNVTPDHDP